ncbi:Zn(2)-C6 fungal-type domain-containing protein [Mycena venus]|uniref:Zn(2)-C6 fungal-type domain-containing protein n=1 Tax=Mycena venus TaxID=2733690 RepID=A0A8H7CHU9_9AGAR|nr:Zn(2)-C6 fungal-type domain-containing protein [Mycena venus]
MASGRGDELQADPDSKNLILTGAKAQRTQRSCDICRQRKIPKVPSLTVIQCIQAMALVLLTDAAPIAELSVWTMEDLKQEIASLKTKLRSLSVCSLCSQPLQLELLDDTTEGTSTLHTTPERDAASSDAKYTPDEQQDVTGDVLAERFGQFSLESCNTKYFGSASNFTLANSAIMYSTDPRVFVDGDRSLSAGWRYANQIRVLRKVFEPTIYEVQMYGLLSLFVLGSSVPQVSWVYIGLGIRCLQQRGEHRRKPEGYKPNAEDEVWKRTFWSFVTLEPIVCVCLGRPMGLRVEEYDVELPLEVDDDYWDKGFMQPLGKPSQLSYFVCLLRICQILSNAMRRLYGSKKEKVLFGWDGPDWEQRVVAEFDSAMNNFKDSVPAHLRWNPDNLSEGTFFDQAATLHITYHYVLTAIHRQRVGVLNTPSLSICASAARTIVHTADIWLAKLQRLPLSCIANPVFVSGIILVLYMFGTKRAGLPIDRNPDVVRVTRALEILKFAETRLQPMGRLWELLQEIWSLDGPLPLRNPAENGADSGNADASQTGAPASVALNIPAPPLATIPGQYFSHLQQSPDCRNLTNLATDQPPGLRPGVSIEQLLEDVDPLVNMDNILDDELMSIWMAAPADASTIKDWDAYIENARVDINWDNGFGAKQ